MPLVSASNRIYNDDSDKDEAGKNSKPLKLFVLYNKYFNCSMHTIIFLSYVCFR